MASAIVTRVRSVRLGVPDVAAAADFYADVWGLVPVGETDGVVYLSGSGQAHHLLALSQSPVTEVIVADLWAVDTDALEAGRRGVLDAGARDVSAIGPIDEPGGGRGFAFTDPEGRRIRLICDDERRAPAPQPDRPIKITHLVLNAIHARAMGDFYEQALGFRTIDTTRAMVFLNCADDHHALAFAFSDNAALNHIAFEMADIDAVMRGAGRMQQAGYPIHWGVGRHGPGANVFSYFIGPSGEVIEYTAEIQQVDADYPVGQPQDWTWPPGRLDRWGIATGPTPELKSAQRRVLFAGAVG